MIDVQRIIREAGVRNLRDLGGYETADGGRIRWRTLFRSGTLGPFHESDLAVFRALGIRTVCDLRTQTERAREPFVFDGIVATESYLAWDYDTVHEWASAFGEAPSPATARKVMFEVYEALPGRFADRFGTIFRKLAAGETPLLFNCSAGKDRTGITAALILTALGVPRATILEDYAMSDKIVDYEREVVQPRLAAGESAAAGFAAIAALPPSVRAPLLASDPDYLDHALTHIERTHASIERFLAEVAGIDATLIAQTRRRLVEH
jgi:protein-tyrosine phosphatase